MKLSKDKKPPFVMIVDDSDIDLYLNQKIIEMYSKGFKILTFTEASKALAYFKNNTEIPDILLLDINMPLMNGFEFLDEFKLLPQEIKNKCSVYLLSSSLNPNDKTKAEQNNYVKTFFEKPLNQKTIQRIEEAYYSS